MSDKDKNRSGDSQGEQRSSNNGSGKTTGKSDTGRLNESDGWGKIDKKGQGAGDRPKRDK